MNKKSIFITGGAGYCGTRLIPQLIKSGHKITVYDNFYFGNFLQHLAGEKLKLIKGDIRDTEKIKTECKTNDIFISLACISNDASFALDEDLSTSINMDAFEPMVAAAKESKIKRFVYASSSSVYGVSDEKNVTEEHPLLPLTLYNKFKGLCEPILKKYTDESFEGVIFRPATVCGYSARLRLDLSVNILTNHAINKNKITVFGGSQLRPNLHIQDYCDVVELLALADIDKIRDETFNVGFQNMSIMDLAILVKKVVLKNFPEKGDIPIEITESDDNRSYHINSEKIKKILNFQPKHSIEDAITELCDAFKNGKIINSFENDIYFNVKRLKNLEIK